MAPRAVPSDVDARATSKSVMNDHAFPLRPARRTRDEPNVTLRDVELVGQQPEQRLVRGSLDGRRGDARTKHTIGHPFDVVGSPTRRQADGEADIGRVQDDLVTGRLA